jgi:hypothetical protein
VRSGTKTRSESAYIQTPQEIEEQENIVADIATLSVFSLAEVLGFFDRWLFSSLARLRSRCGFAGLLLMVHEIEVPRIFIPLALIGFQWSPELAWPYVARNR